MAEQRRHYTLEIPRCLLSLRGQHHPDEIPPTLLQPSITVERNGPKFKYEMEKPVEEHEMAIFKLERSHSSLLNIFMFIHQRYYI